MMTLNSRHRDRLANGGLTFTEPGFGAATEIPAELWAELKSNGLLRADAPVIKEELNGQD